MRYRNWTITRDIKPIPDRRHDWEGVHDDYDGPGDPRCVTAASSLDVVALIDEAEQMIAEATSVPRRLMG